MCTRFKVEERVMYNNNVSNVLNLHKILSIQYETEDVVGNIESNLLGIDMDKLQPNGKKKRQNMKCWKKHCFKRG